MTPDASRRVSPSPTATVSPAAEPVSTREWLQKTHAQLKDLMPAGAPAALLTEDMVVAEGQPVDVFKHFNMRRKSLQSVLGNWEGISYTAQAACRSYCIDEPAPPWDGFEDVWIPITEKLSMNGRLGFAQRDGKIIDAECIVILPGLFGDNGVQRTKDLAVFLRDSGFHVLALELRGHGRTEYRYPDRYHTFGVVETNDLMAVDDWLMTQPHVQRTGLVGYCWGANIALLAAWDEVCLLDDPSISPELAAILVEHQPRPRFTAGVIAFSPILRWEDLMDDLEQPVSSMKQPVYAAIQQTVEDREVRKGYAEPHYSLRKLVHDEFVGYNTPLPNDEREGFPFTRLMPYKNEPIYDKMSIVRTPVLIVHGCNDPLAPSQDVADFIAGVDNPRVAAVILPSGGHVGFAAYAKEYYYSLIANFFDPTVGPAAGVTETASQIAVSAATRMDGRAGSPAAHPLPPGIGAAQPAEPLAFAKADTATRP